MTEVEWMEQFGKNLTSMMADAGYTQKDLAEETGLSESTISKYANGTHIPKATAIINIATALNCDYEDLIDFGEDIYF